MDSWVDGQPADALSLKDRGLAYGDGLFETDAVRGGAATVAGPASVAPGTRLFTPGDHHRSRADPQRAAGLRRSTGRGRCSASFLLAATARGYAPDPAAQARRILQGNAPATLSFMRSRVFACFLAPHDCPGNPLLAGLKHLNRLEQVIARSEWQDTEHAEGRCSIRPGV